MIGGTLVTTEVDLSAAPAFIAASAETFQLPPLYRLGGDGKIWVWVISFDGESLVSCWETLNNFQQGLIQSSTRRVEMNSRSASLYSQALQEAQHEHKNKKDKQGYGESLIQHDIFSIPAMLCTEWKPLSNQLKPKSWPLWVQAKLDGIRCRAHHFPEDETKTPMGVYLLSRATQVICFMNHLREEFVRFSQVIREVIIQKHPTISPLHRTDGELYTLNKELTFEQLSGMSRLTKGASPAEHFVKYFMFDLILMIDLPYDQRYLLLQEAYQKHVANQGGARHIFILGSFQVNTKEEILYAHNQFVSQGFEGVIIRKIGDSESYYKGTRCTAVYKYKQFMDDEGRIVGATCSNGGHEDGGIIWAVQDKEGHQFNVRPMGDVVTRKQQYQQYLENPQQFIGHLYKFRFQEKTNDGHPRFPVGLGMVFDRT